MENFMKLFIDEYLFKIITYVVLIVISYIGTICGKAYKKYVDTKTKQSICKTVVTSVEQIYTDLHGDEKLQKALESASAMLTNKGISCTTDELTTLLESAVGEFNNAFNKGK